MKASAVSEKLKQTRRLEVDAKDVSALLNIEDVNHHQHWGERKAHRVLCHATTKEAENEME